MSGGQTAAGVATLIAAGLLYVLPSLVGAHRQVADLPTIVLRNVLLGWTGVVWVLCLGRALRPHQPPSPSPAERPPARVQSERMPNWVKRLPGNQAWRALPHDTAPIHLDDHPERS